MDHIGPKRTIAKRSIFNGKRLTINGLTVWGDGSWNRYNLSERLVGNFVTISVVRSKTLNANSDNTYQGFF